MINIGMQQKVMIAGIAALVTGIFLFTSAFNLYDLSIIPEWLLGIFGGVNSIVGYNLLKKKRPW